MITETSIKELKGIGEKTEKLFAKIGISTVGDMLRYYPRGYDIYEEPVSRRTGSGSKRHDFWPCAGIREPQPAGDNDACERSDRNA